jgi:hypothetical protein
LDNSAEVTNGSPRCAGLLAEAQRVVEDNPRAPERPRQRYALTGARVQAKVVPKLHADHVTQLAMSIDILTGCHRAFGMHVHLALWRSTGTPSSPAGT